MDIWVLFKLWTKCDKSLHNGGCSCIATFSTTAGCMPGVRPAVCSCSSQNVSSAICLVCSEVAIIHSYWICPLSSWISHFWFKTFRVLNTELRTAPADCLPIRQIHVCSQWVSKKKEEVHCISLPRLNSLYLFSFPDLCPTPTQRAVEFGSVVFSIMR